MTSIIVNYSSIGLKCPNNLSRNNSLVIYITCDQNASLDSKLQPILLQETPCEYSVLISAPQGCPVISTSTVIKFINDHTPFFSVAFIIFGVSMGLFGLSMWPTIIFGIVAFTGTTAIMVTIIKYVYRQYFMN